MAVGFDDLPPHRQLRQLLEVAMDCLDEATSLDDTLGVLPHWARGELGPWPRTSATCSNAWPGSPRASAAPR